MCPVISRGREEDERKMQVSLQLCSAVRQVIMIWQQQILLWPAAASVHGHSPAPSQQKPSLLCRAWGAAAATVGLTESSFYSSEWVWQQRRQQGKSSPAAFWRGDGSPDASMRSVSSCTSVRVPPHETLRRYRAESRGTGSTEPEGHRVTTHLSGTEQQLYPEILQEEMMWNEKQEHGVWAASLRTPGDGFFKQWWKLQNHTTTLKLSYFDKKQLVNSLGYFIASHNSSWFLPFKIKDKAALNRED